MCFWRFEDTENVLYFMFFYCIFSNRVCCVHLMNNCVKYVKSVIFTSAKFQLLLLGFLKLFHDWQKFSGLQRSSRHRPRSLIPNQRSRWQCQWTSSIFPNSRPWAAVIHIPFQLSEFSVFSLRNIWHDLKKSWKFSDFISENDPLGQIAKCYTCWHYQNGHAIRGRTKATAKGRK